MPCNDCDLSKKCKNSYTIGRGSKPRNTEIMIIQEAPTRTDDAFRQSLTCDTKAKINYLFEKAGIDYNKVYFTSAVKCNPLKTSKIKKKHLIECSKYLFNEIIEHKPKIIIAMGRWAWQAVSNYTGVREFRGHFDTFELDYDIDVNGKEIERTFSCKVMPTFSLLGSMGKWEYHADIIRDFSKANKYVKTNIIDRTPEPEYNTILTKSGLNDFVEKYREVEFATTDFETTGFNFWEHKIINTGYCSERDKADILYLQPYLREHMAKYDKKKNKWKAIWTKDEIDRARQINLFLKYNRNKTLEAIKTVNGFKHLKLILHNGKFDSKFAIKNKIPYKNFWFDTLVADSLIDENLGHALNIAMERRGINYGAYDTKLWKYINKDEKNKKTYQYIPPTLLEKYLAVDVCGDFRLWETQTKELDREKMTKHFFNRKMPALKNLIKMEYNGVKMDRKLLLESSVIIRKTQKSLNEKIVKLTGLEELNVNSPKQVINYMVDAGYPFERLNIKRTDGGGYSTAREEMEKFTKFKKWKKFPQLVLNQKKLSKIKGTYIDGTKAHEGKIGGMLKYFDESDFVHANFNIWTARTSRYSCNAPSLQVWPRPIKGLPNTRNFVIPHRPDWCLFEADYSQLEQIVVANLSKDKTLIKRIQRGMDLHCINASDIGSLLNTVPSWVTYDHMLITNEKQHKIENQDDKYIQDLLRRIKLDGSDIDWHEKRTQAKGIGFGLNYGKVAMTFAEDFGISIDEAEEMVDAYFDVYSGLKKWGDNQIAFALKNGYVTLLSGRKRRLHGAVDWINCEHSEGVWSRQRLKEEIGRQAKNAPVQGGAHEIFEPACNRLFRRIRKEKLKARLLLSIHDGIVGECPVEERPMIKQIISEEMPITINKGSWDELTFGLDQDFYKREWYGDKIKI